MCFIMAHLEFLFFCCPFFFFFFFFWYTDSDRNGGTEWASLSTQVSAAAGSGILLHYFNLV